MRVDSHACEGHGRCYDLAPDVFAEDDRGHCLLAVSEVEPALEDQARKGAANCPEHAIAIQDD